jgi:hypothetical protein
MIRPSALAAAVDASACRRQDGIAGRIPIIAAVAAIVGAFIDGQIGKAAGEG